MRDKTSFTEADLQMIGREWQSLKDLAAKRCASEQQTALVQKAFEFASTVHDGVRRGSGEPYILHPIAVAKIVVENLGLGYKSICAALLHDVTEDTSYTIDDIRNLFGEKIAMLVEGMGKVKTVLDNEDSRAEQENIQAENFKRILLTLSEDVRVVLIKLADRLHNCRTIDTLPEYKRDKILSETMHIFIPLAHRLGLYEVKSEMEDIWLRHTHPAEYSNVKAFITHYTSSRSKVIEEFLEPVTRAMDASGYRYTIKKRIKSPYSIWHKVQTKHVAMDQISDLYAVRIIFTPEFNDMIAERNECFRIFSLITSIYDYIPERVRDWIMQPKENGYEALHLTALTHDKRTSVEVQIRSQRMDDIAEKGISAHWNYKKVMPQSEESPMDRWIQKVKDVLQDSDQDSVVEKLDIIRNDLVESEIYVFDPRGTEYSIHKGATALDFGHLYDPDHADMAIAAKVNHKLAPLTYVLQTGDTVEIIWTSRKI